MSATTASAPSSRRPGRILTRGLVPAGAVGTTVGLLDGLSAVLSNANDSGVLLPEPWRAVPLAVAAVLGTTWAWGMTAFVVGVLVQRPLRAAVLGVLALWLAVGVYYGVEMLASTSGEGFDQGTALMWAQLAVPAGVVFGGLGGALHLHGRWWAAAAAPVLWYAWTHPDLYSSLTDGVVIVANRVACVVVALLAVAKACDRPPFTGTVARS